MAEQVTETPEVQSEVLTPEEAAQVVSEEGQEPEVILPSEQETFEIPEKFQGKTMEDVVKAYMELEKMKGGGQEISQEGEEPSTETPSEEETSDDKPDEDTKDNVDLSKFEEKFMKEGKLDEEDFAELEKLGYSKEQVQEHIEFVEWKRERAIKSVLEPIGISKEEFKAVTEWVAQNKSPDEIQAINQALASSPVPAQQAIIQGLMVEYSKADAGPIHTNTPQSRPSKGYATESEFMADISNPAYQHDKSYVKKVEEKLAMTDTTQWGWGV